MIQCEICKKFFKVVTWKHLKFKHGVDINFYDAQYGIQKHSTTRVNPESVKIASAKKRGRTPWNKGLTKHDHPGIMKVAKERCGKNNSFFKIKNKEQWRKNVQKGTSRAAKKRKGKTLEEYYGKEKATSMKLKYSIAAKNRPPTAGHHVPHTKETKDKLREITAKRIAAKKGAVSKLQSNFYNKLLIYFPELTFKMQYFFKFYAIDIAIPDLKIAIEVDGDFWHVNEQRGYEVKYPCQKRNIANDKRKNSFLLERGWSLIRFWESDINENFDKCIKDLVDFIKEVKNGI